MIDSTPEAILLPGQEVEISKSDILEDKEHPNPTQITLKCGDAFIVADVRGNFLASRQEMGLFWHGMRFLRTCNLLLEGRPLEMLSHHVSTRGYACQIDLTNPTFTTESGMVVEQGAIHVCRHLELRYDQLIQTFSVTSFYATPVPLSLSLKVGTDFRDLFEVRGFVRKERGELRPPRIDKESIILSYMGLDKVERTMHIALEPAIDRILNDRVFWNLQLAKSTTVEICLTMQMSESQTQYPVQSTSSPSWHDLAQPALQTNDYLFNRLLERGMHDLMMLSTMTSHGYYPYAGIPWFSCPFGRDGLVASLQFLPWFPQVVRGALAFLASHQGTKFEAFTDEEPGKILHEMRTGELANLRELPYIPYYGTIDATPLFIITLEAYIRWTNDISFLAQIWPNAQAAARWLTDHGDRDGDTFIEYHKTSEKGLSNQGWKDSWDAITHGDGRLVVPPVALCEVQGYAFAAYRGMSYLANRLGHETEAKHWQQAAEKLQENFLRTFWWEEEQVFYLALNGEKEPCDVVSSNSGQCLWTGIVPEDKAQKIIQRLMREDMYSGWGIRTLSTHAARYNPMSYHNGSVWPHDTALVGAGFARYGGKAEASQLLKSMYEASLYYEGSRLPELYCGFTQQSDYGPTRYPVACSPQAWAAGVPFCLLNALLGFQPDAEKHQLTLNNPTLPDWLQMMEVNGIYVGAHHVHLRFVRSGKQTEVVVEKDNEVAIRIQK